METPDTQTSLNTHPVRTLASALLSVLLGVWLVGSFLFFLVRFSVLVYGEHQGAIDQLLGR